MQMTIKQNYAFVLSIPHQNRVMRNNNLAGFIPLTFFSLAVICELLIVYNLHKLLTHSQITYVVMVSKNQVLSDFQLCQ